jgi:sugar lactone lactonase YvrE
VEDHLGVKTTSAEVVIRQRSNHAEAPFWDVRRKSLIWVDQHRGLIREAPGGVHSDAVRTVAVGASIGALVPNEGGGWLVASGSGFQQLSTEGQLSEMIGVLPQDGVQRRWNDGKADPIGRFWCGTIANDARPRAASLYMLERGCVTTVLSDLTISNGLAWNADGSILWHIDTPTRLARRFRVYEDRVEPTGEAIKVDAQDGYPDGMCIDEEGCLWIALWNGSAVQRYSPDGEVLQRIEVAARQVSSCCFGGDSLDTLFITTSAEKYGPAELRDDPEAGHIFAVQLDIRGTIADSYRP